MKRIYKNEWKGEPQSDLVLDNKFRGVFGERVDISSVPRDNPSIPNILTTQRRTDNYHFISRVSKVAGYILMNINNQYAGGWFESGMIIGNRSVIQYSHNFNFDIDFSFSYSEPIENVNIDYVRLYYDRFQYSASQNQIFQITNAAANWILDRYPEIMFTQFPEQITVEDLIQPLDALINRPPTPMPTLTENFIDFEPPTNISINSFRVDFRSKLETSILSNFAAASGSGAIIIFRPDYQGMQDWYGFEVSYNAIQPKYIEVSIRGDTYRLTPQAFQHGSEKNAYEIHQNSLITTRSTVGNNTLPQWITSKIAGTFDTNGNVIEKGEWYDGKQNISLTKIMKDETSINRVQDEAVVINARDTDLQDVNRQSIARRRDGTAKSFDITNAEFDFNRDSFTQNLDMAEITKKT